MKVVKTKEMTENFLELSEKTDQFHDKLVDLVLQAFEECGEYEAYQIVGNSFFKILAKLCHNTYDPESAKKEFMEIFEAYFDHLKEKDKS